MWAFATLRRAHAATLTLCRDRFGEKPLYLLRDGDGGLYFGSEAKFVFALPGAPRPSTSATSSATSSTATRRSTRRADTFFEGVEELPPGHVLRASAPTATETRGRYWRPPRPSRDDMMASTRRSPGARERLIRSVELRLRADVPLAFCMSGGIDSIVADLDRHATSSTTTCTASRSSTRDERYEEQDMVEHAVERLGAPPHADPARHDGLPAAPARARPPPRRARLHDHLLRRTGC